MKNNRVIVNYSEFLESMGDAWKYAYKMFQQANPSEDDEDVIVSKYDAEGFCIFERSSNQGNKWMFNGTVK
jgi:hypothetical protein